MTRPRLILFAGRPGVGKSTLARKTARRTGPVYLRIDTIEAGLRRAHAPIPDLMDAGYTVAQALALDALNLGQTVVADAVHGHRQAWEDWNRIAQDADTSPLWLHITCSDVAEHRTRVDARAAEGASRGADWAEVTSRPLDAAPAHWPVIDTAGRSRDVCLSTIFTLIDKA